MEPTVSAQPIGAFIETLASSAPTPGGGGASALVGAVGVALGNMVGSLTLGKQKYADVQEDIAALKEKAAALQNRLLALADEDAKAFAPLAAAYGLPKDTEQQRAHKAAVMEAALERAAAAPMDIMRAACEAIGLHEQFAQKGSAIAISDVGCGVALCKAALMAASLNVFINTKAMQNRKAAETLNAEANRLVEKYTKQADEVYQSVAARLR